MSDPAEISDLRRSAYLLLMAVAVAIAAARVVGAENVYEPSRYKPANTAGYGRESLREWPQTRPEPTPMFSSNDRSRWATVRALVDNETYVIGQRENFREKTGYRDTGIIFENDYKSLDVVMNPETGEFYSSKPPLMPTLIAGEYWVLKWAFGWSIVDNRWLVMPVILLTVNVLPFALYLVLLARLIELLGKTDFGRVTAFATACFGTLLTTFSGTLNNHLPAACCTLFAVYPLVKAGLEDRNMGASGSVVCGFFAGFAATFELPALSLVAAIGIPLVLARPRDGVLFFLPAAAIPMACLLGCNRYSMGTFLPAYSEFGGPWYNFAGSHWAKWGTTTVGGLDFNTEPTSLYALHLLVGHHGWFSLTPIWLIAFVVLVTWSVRSLHDVGRLFEHTAKGSAYSVSLFGGMVLVISVVVFIFYLTRTTSYNYGGNTSGPRWLFWLIPLWLIALPEGADRMATKLGGRLIVAVLLGFAALSVFYPLNNPWRSPWILQLMEFGGWVRY